MSTTQRPRPAQPQGSPIVGLTRRQLAVAAGIGVLLAIIAFVIPNDSLLSPIQAIILGAVEGITEFLPVSSTGHLVVVEHLLGLGSGDAEAAANTYAVAIQIGAIVAVFGVYRDRIWSMLRGLVGRDPDGLALLTRIVVAFVPAAVVGVIAADAIQRYLFGVWPVVVAWAVGGVFLLVWSPSVGSGRLNDITYRQAVIIGGAQILAMWPGTSRSLATIVAALAVGLSMRAAVEFSFLLGLATLSAATIFDLGKHGQEVLDQFGWATPLLGAAVACLTAFVAVNWFVAYLRTRPLTVFGWYRLAIAAITTVLVLVGLV